MTLAASSSPTLRSKLCIGHAPARGYVRGSDQRVMKREFAPRHMIMSGTLPRGQQLSRLTHIEYQQFITLSTAESCVLQLTFGCDMACATPGHSTRLGAYSTCTNTSARSAGRHTPAPAPLRVHLRQHIDSPTSRLHARTAMPPVRGTPTLLPTSPHESATPGPAGCWLSGLWPCRKHFTDGSGV